MAEYCQIVRIRLRPDTSEAWLLSARSHFVEAFKQRYPELIEARLVRLKPGLYLDTWRWRTRDAASEAFEKREQLDGYRDWDGLVEIIAFEDGVLVSRDP